ncbi:golgin subfamily A member 6-like protein 1 [Oreochromis niloticus]|uniref:golgin subfamily A member 6-like protein 1 n=1 Tax=Oreochromis niloticus TaxID=8128 RepID=UPI000904A0C8|nr:golgin subfamily A member 6-like protein 1 [Oreochromis niloticus]
MLVSIRPATVEATMSSVQYLREFIKERLTAVCEEIFSEVQKTIVQYEEEINRQHRLLDISQKPDRNSHITDPPQQHDREEEEGLDEQQVCNQERNSSLDQEDPEPPQIKEEQEELCSSQEGEQLGLKQEAEGIIVWTDEEQLRLMETIWKPVIKLHRIDVQQQHAFEEEEVFTDQEVCNQERNSSLDQEDPEPPKIKEEQEELCSNQEGEQLGRKQETDAFIVTSACEESAHSESEPNSEQLLSHSSPEAESRDPEENQHVDSGSIRNAELKKERHRKRSHSQRVDNTPVSVVFGVQVPG